MTKFPKYIDHKDMIEAINSLGIDLDGVTELKIDKDMIFLIHFEDETRERLVGSSIQLMSEGMYDEL